MPMLSVAMVKSKNCCKVHDLHNVLSCAVLWSWIVVPMPKPMLSTVNCM